MWKNHTIIFWRCLLVGRVSLEIGYFFYSEYGACVFRNAEKRVNKLNSSSFTRKAQPSHLPSEPPLNVSVVWYGCKSNELTVLWLTAASLVRQTLIVLIYHLPSECARMNTQQQTDNPLWILHWNRPFLPTPFLPFEDDSTRLHILCMTTSTTPNVTRW